MYAQSPHQENIVLLAMFVKIILKEYYCTLTRKWLFSNIFNPLVPTNLMTKYLVSSSVEESTSEKKSELARMF